MKHYVSTMGFTSPHQKNTGKLMKYCPSLIVSLLERLTKLMKGFSSTQKEGESFESFHAAIRTLIRTSNYCEDCVDSILQDQIVIGIRGANAQTSLLKQRSLTLQQAIDLCKAAENASTQGKALRPETVHKVTSAKSSKHKGTPARDRDPHKQT